MGRGTERQAPAGDDRLPQGQPERALPGVVRGQPDHPHTSRTPVTPGEVTEYVIRIYPFATTFLPGHKLVAELSNNEPMSDEHNSLLPPDAFHLPIGRRTTTTVYRDAHHESRLVLPFARA